MLCVKVVLTGDLEPDNSAYADRESVEFDDIDWVVGALVAEVEVCTDVPLGGDGGGDGGGITWREVDRWVVGDPSDIVGMGCTGATDGGHRACDGVCDGACDGACDVTLAFVGHHERRV